MRQRRFLRRWLRDSTSRHKPKPILRIKPHYYGKPEDPNLLVIIVLYVIPRTAILGGIFLTAYMGAATTSMLLKDVSVAFPIATCALAWVSLYLRDVRVKSIFAPLRET